MLRSILGVLVGLATAFAVMMGLETIGTRLFPLPPGISLENEADLARVVEASSTGMKLWVVFGWAAAGFVGAWVAARISHHHKTVAALTIGTLIALGTVMNAVAIPHPAWMNALGVLLPLPLAWLAARLAGAGGKTP